MNYIKIFLLMLFLGISMVGCDTFLEPSPDNQNPYSRILKDAAFAEGLLTNGYVRIPTAYSLNDVATDDAVSNDNTNGYRRMATGELSSLYNPLDVWANAYAAIYNLNYFLTIVDKVEWSWQDQVRNNHFKTKFRGEALALRGYFYQLLLSNYGGVGADDNLLGVPLVTSPIGVDDDWRIPRSTVQATIDQINADYNAAKAILPYTWENTADLNYSRVYGAQNMFRIQGQIITALQSRLALLIASPAFNDGSYDATKAAAAATMVAPLLDSIGGVAGLPPDGVQFYNTDGDATGNADIFWRNNYFVSNSLEVNNFPPSSFGDGRVNPTQNLVDAFPDIDGYPIASSALYDPADPYTNRDPRLKTYILTHGTTFKGVVMDMSPNSSTNDGLNKLPLYSTRTGYYLLKLLRSDASANPNSPSTRRHFYAHMRYTELFLNYAEAANEAWGPDNDNGLGMTARDVIAAIRQRAGITQPDAYLATITTQADMRALIRNERRLELCFEGFRFWDLRRWQAPLTEAAKGVSISGTTFTPFTVETRGYPSNAYSMPIPNQEIIKAGLVQNKGW